MCKWDQNKWGLYVALVTDVGVNFVKFFPLSPVLNSTHAVFEMYQLLCVGPLVLCEVQHLTAVVLSCRLHDEIEDFYRYMQPTPAEHQMRLGVIQRIKEVILGLWPQAEVPLQCIFSFDCMGTFE